MKHQTTLHISSPCSEDWTGMTPIKEGKFCAACSKQVTDFTIMTDQQVLTFLSKQSSHLCGRFQESQLDRALVETKVSKRKSLWLAITLPFVLLFQKSFGQKHQVYKGDTTVQTEPVVVIAGGVAHRKEMVCEPVKTTSIIRGIITDDQNKPIPYATILNKGTNRYATSDSSGHFSIEVIHTNSITLVASYIGYTSAEKQIKTDDYNKPAVIVMKIQPAVLGEVVVTGYPTGMLRETMGGITVCRSITRKEKTDSAVKKAIGIHPFVVYPNPAGKGSFIHINIKRSGDYELQLLDNHSALIKTQLADGQSDGASVSFLIPDHISSGMYYIRMIDKNKSKSSLEKIIVQ